MNLGDYFTKNNPPIHHLSMRQTYMMNAIVQYKSVSCEGVLKLETSDMGNTGLKPNLSRYRIYL